MQEKFLEECSEESEVEKGRGRANAGVLRTTSVDFSKLNIDALRRFQVGWGKRRWRSK